MIYDLKDCRDRVTHATIASESTHKPNLHLDIDDAYLRVREAGEAPHTYLDSALSNSINLERRGAMKLDDLMLSLAKSAFYQAISSDFMNHRLNPDGTLNRKALYRLHARLFQAGRMMERTKAKRALESTQRAE